MLIWKCSHTTGRIIAAASYALEWMGSCGMCEINSRYWSQMRGREEDASEAGCICTAEIATGTCYSRCSACPGPEIEIRFAGIAAADGLRGCALPLMSPHVTALLLLKLWGSKGKTPRILPHYTLTTRYWPNLLGQEPMIDLPPAGKLRPMLALCAKVICISIPTAQGTFLSGALLMWSVLLRRRRLVPLPASCLPY